MPQLFGRESLIFNMHLFSHIPEFVKSHGALESFSAFEFENYLGMIKRRLRPTRGIFMSAAHQTVNLSVNEMKPFEVTYSNNSPNNFCILCDGTVGLIKHVKKIDGEWLASGYKLMLSENLYTTPYNSSLLKIGNYSMSHKKFTDMIPVKKCIGYQKHDSCEFIIFPFV